MATRRKRNLNFLPAESRTEPAIDISAYPVDIGVGELMRLTRERLGHELQTVANQLRIRLSYLEAIEDSRFRDLPGTTYAVGFVRSYADYLGLDGADIVRRFREEAARIHGTTKLVFPALTAEGKLPRAAVLLVSALGLAVVYGIWYVISSQQQTTLQEVAEVPDRLIALAPSVDESERNGPTPSRPTESATADSASAEPPSVLPDPIIVPAEPPATAVAPSELTVVADPGAGSASAAVPIDAPGEDMAESEPALGESEAAATAPAAPIVAAPTEAPAAAESGGSTADISPIAPANGSGEQTAAIEPRLDAEIGETSRTESTESTAPQIPIPESPIAAVGEPAASPSAPGGDTNAIPAVPALPAVEPDGPVQQAALPAPSDAGIVLEARLETWIKVVNASNKTVTQQVLKAGDRYAVPNEPGLVLRTGNAGGLDVLVNGRKAPALGEVGAVYTRIQLDPSRLLDGTAVDD